MIDYTYLCPTCLRDYTGWHYNLAHHAANCRLPYTNRIEKRNDLVIYGLTPTTPLRERKFAERSVVATMGHSDDIDADLNGWEAAPTKEERKKYQPHAFVAVLKGATIGVAVVVKKKGVRAFLPKRGKLRTFATDSTPRWCVNRIWLAKQYRGKGHAGMLVLALASYLKIEPSELGWVVPLSFECEELVRSLAGNWTFLAA